MKTLTNSNVVVTVLPLFQSTVGLSFASQRLQQTTKTTKSLTCVIGALKYKKLINTCKVPVLHL